MTRLAVLAGLAIAFLVASGVEASISGPASVGVPGDVNCDQVADALDALALVRASGGLESSAECADENGDLDCDEQADYFDALIILALISGVEVGECGAAPPTTLEKIDQALADGDIDNETAVLYYTYALFSDDRLPLQYQGSGIGGGDSAMSYIGAQLDSLSPQTRAQVEPFLIPPFHAGSWWAAQNPAAVPAGLDQLPGPILDGQWAFIEGLNGKFKVWYLSDVFADRQTAQQVANEIDFKIWPAITDLLQRDPLPDGGSVLPGRGDDDRLDIVLVDGLGKSMANGFGPNWCEKTSAYLLLDDIQMPADSPIVAHEFFHAVEFTYDFEFRAGGSVAGCPIDAYNWWSEASAHWSIDYVYPDNQYEHEDADRYLRYTWLPLHYGPIAFFDTLGGLRKYGEYVLPFYLAHKYSPDVIREVFENAENTGIYPAIDMAIPDGLEEAWPDFALKNWNREQIDEYREWDDLTVGADLPEALMEDERFFFGQPFVDYGALGEHDGVYQFRPAFGLFPMGIQYFRFVIDEDVRFLSFYNGISGEYAQADIGLGKSYVYQAYVDPAERKGIKLWAFVKINGVWQEPEDWTEKPARVYCRDVPQERVEEIVLIFSNSDYESLAQDPWFPKGEPPAFWASDMGCARWEGTITNTRTFEFGSETITGEDLVFVRDPAQVYNDAPNYAVNYNLVSGNISWEYNDAPPGCTITGSASGVTMSMLHDLQTINEVISGPYHRSANGTMNSEEPVFYRQTCTGSPPEDVEHYVGLGLACNAIPFVIEGDGGVLEGSCSEGGFEATWHLEAVRE